MWVVAVVAALLVAVWAGMKIFAFVTEYPAQIAVAGISFAVLTVTGIAVHVHRVLHDRVPLTPPPPRAIAQGPSSTVILPYINAVVPDGTCEGPGCGKPHGTDPYSVAVARSGQAEEEHRFCSRPCCDNWIAGTRGS